MFLSTFSRKLYKHLNIFIQIGHVSWHLLNMFLSIFVTILLFFISTNQNHFKIKNKKKNFIISNLNQNQPNPQKNIKPNKTFNFYYFQTLTNTIKPQLQTYSQTQIKPKSLNLNQISNQHFQTPNLLNFNRGKTFGGERSMASWGQIGERKSKKFGRREIHCFMRTDRGEEEQKIWEERAEQSIREER